MKNIRSLSISTGITIVSITILTILAEMSTTFKIFLSSVTGHHWVTKGIISLILFFGLYFLLVRTEDDLDIMKETIVITILTTIATLLIFGFYVWHFFA